MTDHAVNPLHEVAIGKALLPRPDLLVPHIGTFWDRIRANYPRCAHADPISQAGNPGVEVLAELPLPRVWFLSADESSLVQVQRDRFICNWRALPGGRAYPGFEGLLAEHNRAWGLWEQHVFEFTGTALAATGYSLTYVNIINRGDGWTSPGDQSKVFPNLGWRPLPGGLPAPEHHAWTVGFPMSDAPGRAKVSLQVASRTHTGEQVLKFEITVESGSLTPDQMPFELWVGRAHRLARHLFLGLTEPSLHRQAWGLDFRDEVDLGR